MGKQEDQNRLDELNKAYDEQKRLKSCRHCVIKLTCKKYEAITMLSTYINLMVGIDGFKDIVGSDCNTFRYDDPRVKQDITPNVFKEVFERVTKKE